MINMVRSSKRLKLNNNTVENENENESSSSSDDSNSNSNSDLSSEFVPSVKYVSTLKDLIVIGSEYESFQKTAKDERDNYIEELISENKDTGRKLLELPTTAAGERKKKLLKRTVARNKIKIKAANDIYDEEFSNTDYGRLVGIVPELHLLENMIGLKKLKDSVANQILFFIQKLNSNEMMHTVIFGSPGTGKTVTGRILGQIYTKLGYLSKGSFTVATRSDFVGKFLGHTANKTQKLLESCKGGVMFLDEAYSMGNKDEKDSFSKEAIDTINQFLSENSEDFIMVIAGYEKDVKECFFAYNQGLERRFPWRFTMDSYSGDELKEIFNFQIKNDDWEHSEDFLGAIKFEVANFKFNGGDTLVLLDKCKMAHAKRVFGKRPEFKKILNKDDFEEGMKLYCDYKNDSKNKKNSAMSMESNLSMYI
jgi:hypothetical protein